MTVGELIQELMKYNRKTKVAFYRQGVLYLTKPNIGVVPVEDNTKLWAKYDSEGPDDLLAFF